MDARDRTAIDRYIDSLSGEIGGNLETIERARATLARGRERLHRSHAAPLIDPSPAAPSRARPDHATDTEEPS